MKRLCKTHGAPQTLPLPPPQPHLPPHSPNTSPARENGEPFLPPPGRRRGRKQHLSPRAPKSLFLQEGGKSSRVSPSQSGNIRLLSAGGSAPAPAGRDGAPEPPLTVPLAFPQQFQPSPKAGKKKKKVSPDKAENVSEPKKKK